MTLLVIISFTIYLVWMMCYLRAWNALGTPAPLSGGSTTKISVVVPVRNEEENIEQLVRMVFNQNYPAGLFECIISDDHSDDGTVPKVQQLIKKFPQLQLILPDNLHGKKAALARAIEISTGELVVTIDADVSVNEHWLSTIAAYYETTRCKLIILPIMMKDGNSFLEQVQVLELLSLVGTTAAAASMHSPVMCNGANLAFSREGYNALRGYEGNASISGGDDMFLLIKQKKVSKKSIGYVHDRNAIAWTNPEKKLASLLSQRIRWASKAGRYSDAEILFLAAIVWLVNALTVWMIVSLVLGDVPHWWALLLLILRWLVDFIFLRNVALFFHKSRVLGNYPFLLFIYPLYATLIPLAGIFYRPSWKGRKVKH